MSQPEGSQASGDQENVKEKIIEELTRANGILKANISTLFRTARAEIARKNERIAELQSDLDDILFKRMSQRASMGQNNRKTSQLTSSANSIENDSQPISQNDGERSTNVTI